MNEPTNQRTNEHKAALERLFRLLDTDNTGFLDATKLRRLGRATHGVDSSLVQAQMEINKVGWLVARSGVEVEEE